MSILSQVGTYGMNEGVTGAYHAANKDNINLQITHTAVSTVQATALLSQARKQIGSGLETLHKKLHSFAIQVF
jgi:hypothetical protein